LLNDKHKTFLYNFDSEQVCYLMYWVNVCACVRVCVCVCDYDKKDIYN